jgi:hypothetical protein
MTIRAGEPWGDVGPVPEHLERIDSDEALRALATRCRSEGRAVVPVGLVGGDLMRSVGGTGDISRFESSEVARLPVDIVRVDADGRVGYFVAHLVARRSWWRGGVTAVMNAQFIGRWDVAPRSHPNDGRADLVQVGSSMSVRDRLRALRRLPLGNHVPHPSITIRSVRSETLSWDRPMPIWLDGQRWGSARSVTVTVEPDALTVCI